MADESTQLDRRSLPSLQLTEMARAGIAEEVRRRVVGHATVSVHDAYNQVDVNRLKAAVEAIP